MDEVTQAAEDLKKDWDQTVMQTQERIKVIESCGKSGRGMEEANSLPRLNGAAQEGLALLRSMKFSLDFLAQQLPMVEESQSARSTFESWKEQYQNLHLSSRSANLQAKGNLRKAAQEEVRTKAGMTSAAESITERLRCTRQLMVQEVE